MCSRVDGAQTNGSGLGICEGSTTLGLPSQQHYQLVSTPSATTGTHSRTGVCVESLMPKYAESTRTMYFQIKMIGIVFIYRQTRRGGRRTPENQPNPFILNERSFVFLSSWLRLLRPRVFGCYLPIYRPGPRRPGCHHASSQRAKKLRSILMLLGDAVSHAHKHPQQPVPVRGYLTNSSQVVFIPSVPRQAPGQHCC